MANRSRAAHANERPRGHILTAESGARLGSSSEFPSTGTPKTIGVIVFEQMTAVDLMAPLEAFSRSKIATDKGRDFRCYRIVTIGVSTTPCVTESSIVVKPQVDMQHPPHLDTLIIPGGSGIHNPKVNSQIGKCLVAQAATTRRIAALGTGIYALAATGLLDGRQVVAHWQFAKDLAARFPKLRVNPSNLFVKDGSFYTCSGGISAVDFSLTLIEEDYGRQVALELARELVIHLKRSGDQEQYSEALQFQIQSVSRLSEVATWIVSHLNENLTVEVLAAKACLCPRHFCRRFKREFGHSPAEFVKRLRLDEARRRLSTGDNSIENVGLSVGFQSADAFRRAFERRLAISPSDYRRRFSTAAKTEAASYRRPKLNKVAMAA